MNRLREILTTEAARLRTIQIELQPRKGRMWAKLQEGLMEIQTILEVVISIKDLQRGGA